MKKNKRNYTAPQLAAICEVDVKTIHNWANLGTIRYFKTPGNHLRFLKEDILKFLKEYNFPLPEDLQ